MSDDRTNELIERAITLICSEWGYTRAQARAWLEDDSHGWDHAEVPQREYAPGLVPFIQVQQKTVVKMPWEL